MSRSADVARTTQRIALGKMMNAGQICLAPDYLLVPKDREMSVVGGVQEAATRMYPTLLRNDDYTSVVNDRHFQRLTDWIEDARAKGATVEVVNPGNEDFASTNSRKMPLHIVRDAQASTPTPIGRIDLPGGDFDVAAPDLVARYNPGDRP